VPDCALVLVVLPGVGTLELTHEQFAAALRPIATVPAVQPPNTPPVGSGAALLDAKSVAMVLSLPVSWIREKARQGELPSHRVGRYVRFDLAAVRRALPATQRS
jgi:excisionase family DNA binding protein